MKDMVIQYNVIYLSSDIAERVTVEAPEFLGALVVTKSYCLRQHRRFDLSVRLESCLSRALTLQLSESCDLGNNNIFLIKFLNNFIPTMVI